ncbi:MAG: T9SS type A sorting domain-containing protein [Chitinophagales bacterium]
MRKIVIITMHILYSNYIYSQIYFNNPSFEGTPACGFNYPNFWSYCDYHIGLINDTFSFHCRNNYGPSHAQNGYSYVGLDRHLPNANGSLSQMGSCVFKKNFSYSGVVYAASFLTPLDTITFLNFKKGRLNMYLGTDSCSKSQLIYRSPVLDSIWRLSLFEFTAQENFEILSFWIEPDTNDVVGICLDALSPIYLINANAVHVANKDTVVYTQPNEQKCITVKATSTITTYDTVRWYKLVDTVKVPVAVGLQASVCVDSNTTFLIGLRDSVMGCAGVEWSWDTLRVWVRDTVLGVREVDAVHAFTLQPNPVVDVLTITPSFEGPYDWTITDALGRLSAKGSGRNTTSVPLEGLSRGAYLLQVEGVVRRFLKE